METVTVTKKELMDRIADQTGQKRADVKTVIQTFLDEIVEELRQGHRLEFRDFGVFEIKSRGPRVAQNPKTLARVDVPPRRMVRFKVGRMLRENIESQGPAGA